MRRLLLALAFAAGALAVLPSMTRTAVAQAVATSLPTILPTTAPTSYPTTFVTSAPTTRPTSYATTIPAYATSEPTTAPTTAATSYPTTYPTVLPGTPPPLLHVATSQHSLPSPNPAFALYLTSGYAATVQAGAWQSLGVKQIVYANPLQPICIKPATPCGGGDVGYNMLAAGGAYNAVAARDCSGNLVTGTYGTNKYPVLFLDPTKPGAAAYIQAVEDYYVAYLLRANPGFAHPWDELFIDNDTPTLYNPSATPCGQTAAGWIAATASAIGATTDGPYQVNSLAQQNVANVPLMVGTLAAANIATGDFEGCYGGNTPTNIVAAVGTTFNWLAAEATEIQTIAAGKTFSCYVRLSGDGASYIPQRLYTYASFLLSYDPAHAVIEEALSGGASGLKVFPEMQLVPLNPVTTASDVSGYLTASGAYARSFGRCLYEGNDLGPCCVGVNPSATVTVTSPCVGTRAVVLAGDGIFDGGTLSLGSAPATLGPTSAEIALP